MTPPLPSWATSSQESEEEKQGRMKRDTLVFLQKHGFGKTLAQRVYDTYGDETIQHVSHFPYTLCDDVKNIGFKKADGMALSLGLSKESPARIEKGIQHSFKEIALQGHCGLPREDFVKRTRALLDIKLMTVHQELLRQEQTKRVVNDTIRDRDFQQEKTCVFSKPLYEKEQKVAHRLKKLAGTSLPWQQPTLNGMMNILSRENLCLTAEQSEALKKILGSKVSILTGGPGVGKTTLLNAVVKILAPRYSLVLCAPTGKAARNLSRKTGYDAETLHRTLYEWKVEENRWGQKVYVPTLRSLDATLVIVDEFSMVNLGMMDDLLTALNPTSGLLMVGDADQLSAIGVGNVLDDMIRSRHIPVIQLTEIHRQVQDSPIIKNAHRVNRGLFFNPPISDDDSFLFLEKETDQEIFNTLIQLMAEELPQKWGYDPVRDVQILTPMRKKTALGSDELNIELQQRLNPKERVILRYGLALAPGDKVMQTVNKRGKETVCGGSMDVMNGETGFVDGIDDASETLSIVFDGIPVLYSYDEAVDEIMLAYAVTIHKSQGSEYPAVVIPMTMSHAHMLRRSLLYTAMTRGQKRVFVVGQRKAIELAISEFRREKRWTKLSEWLQYH